MLVYIYIYIYIYIHISHKLKVRIIFAVATTIDDISSNCKDRMTMNIHIGMSCQANQLLSLTPLRHTGLVCTKQ